MPEALATRDLIGVEILAAGGPYHGQGSPPEGDFLTVDDLRAAVTSYEALRGQVDAPVVLGHDEDQTLLRREGLTGTDGEPAAGWLDNLRVRGDRLLADLRKVPEQVARLIDAGAYRKRSVVYHPSIEGPDGKRYRMVVSALGLLGAKLPAVEGLSDIVKLYAAGDAGLREYLLDPVREYAAGPWKVGEHPDCEGFAVMKPDGSLTGCHQTEDSARAQVAKLMKTMGPPARKNTQEASMDELRKALGLADDADDAAVVNAVRSLTAAQQAQRDYAKDLGLDEGADMKAVVEAAIARAMAETPPAKPGEGEEDDGDEDAGEGEGDAGKKDAEEAKAETVSLSRREYDALRKGAVAGTAADRELRLMRRESVLDTAVRDRRITPGERKAWSDDYDLNPDLVTRQLARLQPNPLLEGEVGGDGDGGDAEFTPEQERAYADFMAGMGVTRLATVQKV